jgi:hypothetical protein
MATTSDAAASARTPRPPDLRGRARARLQSVVRSVEAYVAGREPAVVVPAWPPQPAGAPRGTLGGRVAAPWPRPRPVDKPYAVAHYQAMARQLAHERRMSGAGGGQRRG